MYIHSLCVCMDQSKSQAQRRFFHYVAIAKVLGVEGAGNRAKLPPCVQKRIAEMYPDVEGAKTKVGFKPTSGPAPRCDAEGHWV